jgi:O-acetyl-ADP-ribose deacetylase (regulator of RNase III)
MKLTLHDLRFVSTSIAFRDGDPLEHARDALYVSVNGKGVMASGLSGAIRLGAGPEVERELRSHGDLLVGSAYLVASGRLSARGVVRIACGVTTPDPGVPPKRAPAEQAFAMALDMLEDAGSTSLALPEIGTRIPGITLVNAADILATILAARLRRGSRLRDVVIASRHPEYLSHCHSLLVRNGATPE